MVPAMVIFPVPHPTSSVAHFNLNRNPLKINTALIRHINEEIRAMVGMMRIQYQRVVVRPLLEEGPELLLPQRSAVHDVIAHIGVVNPAGNFAHRFGAVETSRAILVDVSEPGVSVHFLIHSHRGVIHAWGGDEVVRDDVVLAS